MSAGMISLRQIFGFDSESSSLIWYALTDIVSLFDYNRIELNSFSELLTQITVRNELPVYCNSKHNNRKWHLKPYKNLTILLLVEGKKTTFQPHSNPAGHRIVQSFQFIQIRIHVGFFHLIIQKTALCQLLHVFAM